MRVGSPILNRELLVFLRGKRSFLGLLIYLAVLGVTAGAVWFACQEEYGQIRRDILSRNLFLAVTIAQLILFPLYAIVMTSMKINAEHDAKTFDLLISTPISTSHLILAKYASVVLVILLLAAASAPVLALCFLLGGISWQDFVRAYYVIFLAVAAYGMLGIACSANSRKNYVALFDAFMLVLLFYIGAVLLIQLLLESAGGFLTEALSGNTRLSAEIRQKIALVSFEVISPMWQYLGGNYGWPINSWLVAGHTVFQVAIFAISLWIAKRRVEATAERPIPGPGRRSRPACEETAKPLLARRLKIFGNRESPPRGGRQLKPIGDQMNPVYVKDSRALVPTGWKQRFWHAVLACVVLILIVLFVVEEDELDDLQSVLQGLGIGLLFSAALFVPIFAARSVTTERESGTLSMLHGTLLRPGEILMGKTAVILKHALRGELMMLGFLLLVVSLPGISSRTWPESMAEMVLVFFSDGLLLLAPLFLITLYFISIGVLFSTICRKTPTAIVLTYGTILLLGLAPLGIWILLEEVLNLPLEDSEAFMAIFGSVSPVLSPWIYFAQDDTFVWVYGGHLVNVFEYCACLLSVCAVLLIVAERRLAREPYREFQAG